MFDQRYAAYLNRIESALEQALPLRPEHTGGAVSVASRYSLLSGGKRIRPVLLLATVDCLGGDSIAAEPYAAALEMIHTYSLIHDDLPCMDNDDYRRGRPTCHKQFGEAMAVLAGDNLLNRAFEIILDNTTSGHAEQIQAGRLIARAAGGSGMIGGQTLDLAAEGRLISPAELKMLHRLKTGQLIVAPVLAACALSLADEPVTTALEQYAEQLGLAFQIQDDILDVTASADKLGKSVGKDLRDQKSTYVSLFGLDEARRLLQETTVLAKRALQRVADRGYDTAFLMGLTDFLLRRDF